MKTSKSQPLFCALVAATLLAACSPSDSETTTTAPGAATTTTSLGTTSSAPTISTTAPTAATTTTAVLPGDPVDGGPPRGAILSVVGVAHDDVLNLRAAPGADQLILDGIPPTYQAVVALGLTRALPAWWTMIEYDGTVGWVNIAYLAYAGATSDMTSSVVSEFGGYPEAATMTDLGSVVSEIVASDDPPSDIVVVVPESTGDLGEVTYDVVGIGDDSVLGFRLHVFGEPTESGFSLKSVEGTVLCQPNRGVTDDGLCV